MLRWTNAGTATSGRGRPPTSIGSSVVGARQPPMSAATITTERSQNPPIRSARGRFALKGFAAAPLAYLSTRGDGPEVQKLLSARPVARLVRGFRPRVFPDLLVREAAA